MYIYAFGKTYDEGRAPHPSPPGDWDDKSCLSAADGLPLLRLPFIPVNAQQEGVLQKYRGTPSFSYLIQY